MFQYSATTCDFDVTIAYFFKLTCRKSLGLLKVASATSTRLVTSEPAGSQSEGGYRVNRTNGTRECKAHTFNHRAQGATPPSQTPNYDKTVVRDDESQSDQRLS
jgi:hypothetical protein